MNENNKVNTLETTQASTLEPYTYVKRIDTTFGKINTIISVLAQLIPVIVIIPLLFSIRKYHEKQRASKDEKERLEYKKKKKHRIIVAILMVISFCYGTIVGMLFQFAAKPIIYLYPEEPTELSVSLGKPENVTCSYPKYNNDGWQVIAHPNGNLKDVNTGRNLYALYWEGITDNKVDFNEGFVVKGEDTIEFLEEKLAILGLNERESEEFIVYWLPKLQDNKYNLIRFATKDEIDLIMPLNFSKQPDTVIRVLMQFKKLNKYKEIPEQNLVTPERKGFVAVEWGGSEIK